MKKKIKKYGTGIVAAVFLIVAGLCYGFGRAGGDESVKITNDGQALYEEKAAIVEAPSEDAEETAALEALESSAMSACYVHVCGEVRNPGVYELSEGSRIFEAVEMAGGFTEDAAEESLNLAGMIADGMQVMVLSREEAESAAAEKAAENSGIVNLNTATKEQLMTLKGVGESRAEDIIRYREESGGFKKIEDIMKVPGIKDAGFQKIKDSITV